jgi:hypothetical protein
VQHAIWAQGMVNKRSNDGHHLASKCSTVQGVVRAMSMEYAEDTFFGRDTRQVNNWHMFTIIS